MAREVSGYPGKIFGRVGRTFSRPFAVHSRARVFSRAVLQALTSDRTSEACQMSGRPSVGRH